MAASDSYSAAGKSALAGKIAGLRAAKRAFQALPQATREAMLGATTETVQAIASGAKARLQSSPSIRTRTLYDAVTWRVTKTNGRGKVGISPLQTRLFDLATKQRTRLKGRVVIKNNKQAIARADRYAHFVEFGTKHMTQEPFMIPATEDQAQPYLARCRAAGKVIEQQVAAAGAGA